jgi:hypothetical protein
MTTVWRCLNIPFHPERKLRPSAESLRHLAVHASQLYDQKEDLDCLWRYVLRWYGWLRDGLSGLVSLLGGFRRYWVYVFKKYKLCSVKQKSRKSKLSRSFSG